MGLREKITLVFVGTIIVSQVAKSMPSAPRKYSLNPFFETFKPVKNNFIRTSPLPTKGIPAAKSKFGTHKNTKLKVNATPKCSMYDIYNFPEIEYPLESTSRNPFQLKGDTKSGFFGDYPIVKEGTGNLPQDKIINDLKKEIRMKRKLNRISDENRHNKREMPSFTKFASGTDPVWLHETGKFPEIQYPMNAIETWTPHYWNPLMFNERENGNDFPESILDTKQTNALNKPQPRSKSKTMQYMEQVEKIKKQMANSKSKVNKPLPVDEMNVTLNDDLVCPVLELRNLTIPDFNTGYISVTSIEVLPNTTIPNTQENHTEITQHCEAETSPQLGTNNITSKGMEPSNFQYESDIKSISSMPIPYRDSKQSNICPAKEIYNTVTEFTSFETIKESNVGQTVDIIPRMHHENVRHPLLHLKPLNDSERTAQQLQGISTESHPTSEIFIENMKMPTSHLDKINFYIDPIHETSVPMQNTHYSRSPLHTETPIPQTVKVADVKSDLNTLSIQRPPGGTVIVIVPVTQYKDNNINPTLIHDAPLKINMPAEIQSAQSHCNVDILPANNTSGETSMEILPNNSMCHISPSCNIKYSNDTNQNISQFCVSPINNSILSSRETSMYLHRKTVLSELSDTSLNISHKQLSNNEKFPMLQSQEDMYSEDISLPNKSLNIFNKDSLHTIISNSTIDKHTDENYKCPWSPVKSLLLVPNELFDCNTSDIHFNALTKAIEDKLMEKILTYIDKRYEELLSERNASTKYEERNVDISNGSNYTTYKQENLLQGKLFHTDEDIPNQEKNTNTEIVQHIRTDLISSTYCQQNNDTDMVSDFPNIENANNDLSSSTIKDDLSIISLNKPVNKVDKFVKDITNLITPKIMDSSIIQAYNDIDNPLLPAYDLLSNTLAKEIVKNIIPVIVDKMILHNLEADDNDSRMQSHFNTRSDNVPTVTKMSKEIPNNENIKDDTALPVTKELSNICNPLNSNETPENSVESMTKSSVPLSNAIDNGEGICYKDASVAVNNGLENFYVSNNNIDNITNKVLKEDYLLDPNIYVSKLTDGIEPLPKNDTGKRDITANKNDLFSIGVSEVSELLPINQIASKTLTKPDPVSQGQLLQIATTFLKLMQNTATYNNKVIKLFEDIKTNIMKYPDIKHSYAANFSLLAKNNETSTSEIAEYITPYEFLNKFLVSDLGSLDMNPVNYELSLCDKKHDVDQTSKTNLQIFSNVSDCVDNEFIKNIAGNITHHIANNVTKPLDFVVDPLLTKANDFISTSTAEIAEKNTLEEFLNKLLVSDIDTLDIHPVNHELSLCDRKQSVGQTSKTNLQIFTNESDSVDNEFIENITENITHHIADNVTKPPDVVVDPLLTIANEFSHTSTAEIAEKNTIDEFLNKPLVPDIDTLDIHPVNHELSLCEKKEDYNQTSKTNLQMFTNESDRLDDKFIENIADNVTQHIVDNVTEFVVDPLLTITNEFSKRLLISDEDNLDIIPVNYELSMCDKKEVFNKTNKNNLKIFTNETDSVNDKFIKNIAETDTQHIGDNVTHLPDFVVDPLSIITNDVSNTSAVESLENITQAVVDNIILNNLHSLSKIILSILLNDNQEGIKLHEEEKAMLYTLLFDTTKNEIKSVDQESIEIPVSVILKDELLPEPNVVLDQNNFEKVEGKTIYFDSSAPVFVKFDEDKNNCENKLLQSNDTVLENLVSRYPLLFNITSSDTISNGEGVILDQNSDTYDILEGIELLLKNDTDKLDTDKVDSSLPFILPDMGRNNKIITPDTQSMHLIEDYKIKSYYDTYNNTAKQETVSQTHKIETKNETNNVNVKLTKDVIPINLNVLDTESFNANEEPHLVSSYESSNNSVAKIAKNKALDHIILKNLLKAFKNILSKDNQQLHNSIITLLHNLLSQPLNEKKSLDKIIPKIINHVTGLLVTKEVSDNKYLLESTENNADFIPVSPATKDSVPNRSHDKEDELSIPPRIGKKDEKVISDPTPVKLFNNKIISFLNEISDSSPINRPVEEENTQHDSLKYALTENNTILPKDIKDPEKFLQIYNTKSKIEKILSDLMYDLQNNQLIIPYTAPKDSDNNKLIPMFETNMNTQINNMSDSNLDNEQLDSLHLN